ncbi:MAG TPA: DEAD/DEAH box helicase family protein [Candidatus Paceibacterota bacterium]|nr:DEAD/DEAH box helicase family protein [Candidatus Paceibacterota bacterium]
MDEADKKQGFVVNSPYSEPEYHFEYVDERTGYKKVKGRREAGYYATVGKQESNDFNTQFIKLELANKIRLRVKEWKQKGYPNITSITKKLLEHWNRFEQEGLEQSEERRYFWCQIEAIETIIWLTEAPDAMKTGINIKDKSDSEWLRACTKLATGTGKTVIMAMVIAWHALNKISNPKDTRFSKNILVVAPGITVKDRLQVLEPSREENFYDEFNVIPPSLKEYIYQAKILILNWHALASIKNNSLPKVMRESMGEESDTAFTKRILSEFPGNTPIVVINDEAHHCHREQAEIGKSREEKGEEEKENEEATVWIQGLDKIHRARGIISAYDLSATPFIPKGRTSNTGFELFNWIISDFGLHDSIESGLVKTPTVAVRDSSYASTQTKEDRSKFFHIYYEDGVREDLNQKCEPNVDLPDLVRNAFKILSTDWLSTKEDWQKWTTPATPSMIVICNNTYTSKRIEYSIHNNNLSIEQMADKERVIRIDSTADDINDEILREKFNTVGKKGKPGENIHCVIGVNMLSEGWDANNVKQILGLRAFTSQLLCEQVIGRGLRRMSYDIDDNGLLKPEYVTIFGIPFSFLPMEGKVKEDDIIDQPKTLIQVVQDKEHYKILFPNILRIQKEMEYFIDVNWSKVEKLKLSPTNEPVWVQVAPVLEKPDLTQLQKMESIKEQLGKDYRLKESIFTITSSIKNGLDEKWNNIDDGNKFQQIYKIVSEYINEKIEIDADKKNYDVYRNILINLSTSRIASIIKHAINLNQNSKSYPISDPVNKFKTTTVMTPWSTTRKTYTSADMKCHISHLVEDSRWENIGKLLDYEVDDLESWVKNDHLGFTIPYIHKGLLRSYFPDFILRFKGNKYLMLEIKGKEREQDKTKWESAELWCDALNNDKASWGEWKFRAIKNKPIIKDLLW